MVLRCLVTENNFPYHNLPFRLRLPHSFSPPRRCNRNIKSKDLLQGMPQAPSMPLSEQQAFRESTALKLGCLFPQVIFRNDVCCLKGKMQFNSNQQLSQALSLYVALQNIPARFKQSNFNYISAFGALSYQLFHNGNHVKKRCSSFLTVLGRNQIRYNQ